MNASGGLLALLVAFWALVLLPVWVRRHQDALAERSTQDFSRAMRVLARNDSEPMIDDPEARRTVLATDDADSTATHEPVRISPQLRRRRARVLSVLLLSTLVVSLLVVISPLSWLLAAPLWLMSGAYLVALRASARREHDLASGQASGQDRAARPPASHGSDARWYDEAQPTADEAYTVSQGRTPDEFRVAAPAEAEPLPQRTVLFDAQADELVIDLREGTIGAYWDPREAPLPTYVSKNELTRRRITLGQDEPWTADVAANDRPDSAAGRGGSERRAEAQSSEPPKVNPESEAPTDLPEDGTQHQPPRAVND